MAGSRVVREIEYRNLIGGMGSKGKEAERVGMGSFIPLDSETA